MQQKGQDVPTAPTELTSRSDYGMSPPSDWRSSDAGTVPPGFPQNGYRGPVRHSLSFERRPPPLQGVSQTNGAAGLVSPSASSAIAADLSLRLLTFSKRSALQQTILERPCRLQMAQTMRRHRWLPRRSLQILTTVCSVALATTHSASLLALLQMESLILTLNLAIRPTPIFTKRGFDSGTRPYGWDSPSAGSMHKKILLRGLVLSTWSLHSAMTMIPMVVMLLPSVERDISRGLRRCCFQLFYTLGR